MSFVPAISFECQGFGKVLGQVNGFSDCCCLVSGFLVIESKTHSRCTCCGHDGTRIETSGQAVFCLLNWIYMSSKAFSLTLGRRDTMSWLASFIAWYCTALTILPQEKIDIRSELDLEVMSTLLPKTFVMGPPPRCHPDLDIAVPKSRD